MWLGYADSGMTGWAQNHEPGAFMSADLDEASERLADIVERVGGDVLTCYDWHGGYGHPDHVKVHQVLHRAAELAARRPRVLESTMNRDGMREMARLAREAGQEDDWDPDRPMDDGNPMGTPEAEIHWQVDVTGLIERKRAALAAHASQTSDVGMMLAMPPEVFTAVFGYEHFLEPGREAGMVRGWPFGA